MSPELSVMSIIIISEVVISSHFKYCRSVNKTLLNALQLL